MSEVLEAMKLQVTTLMAAQGRKQSWLAQESGVSTKHVSQVLTGRVDGSVEMLERWASLLGYRFVVRVRRTR